MLNWIKRHWILSLFLLVGGVPAGLNYSGFCIEQGRWLSDEEFLLAMLGYTEGDTIRNEERKKHLKEHPECCVFERGYTERIDGYFIGLLFRLLGETYAYGQVEYKLSDEEIKARNITDDNYYNQASLTINACGKTDSKSGWLINEQEYGQAYQRYLQNKNK